MTGKGITPAKNNTQDNKQSFGQYLCTLFKYNEFTMFTMGFVVIIVSVCMFLMADRYALAQERISELTKENSELYNYLVIDTFSAHEGEDSDTRKRLNSYKEMLLKRYK